MRILHVLDRSLPTVAGYTTRTASILEGEAAMGLVPRAVTSVREGGGASEFIGGVEHLRTQPPEVLALLEGAPLLREAVEMAALGRRILAIHREEPFELIHAHSPILCGLPAHAAARRLAVPSVYEIRAFWEDAAEQRGQGRRGSARYAAIRALETRLCRSVDAVVTICEGLRRDLVARGVPADRLFLVPNGVDTARFTPAPRDEALAESLGFRGKSVVAYIGTLFHFEGVKLMLEALGRLGDARDDVRGLVIGQGEAEPELRELCERLGLAGRVVITGKVPPADVLRYYALADVLVYPRERHRITELVTPLKPLEAMSMARAVVASDVGGLRELVRDGETGLLFRAGDAEALAGALARVIGDADLRRGLGARGRAWVTAERAWAKLAARYLDVYAAATERRIEAKGFGGWGRGESRA
jgi:PEP-CTERM/exosortase A-associated glycosyltransferase